MIWDEVAMPGYGLYDRALGATYLNGLWKRSTKRHSVESRIQNSENIGTGEPWKEHIQ